MSDINRSDRPAWTVAAAPRTVIHPTRTTDILVTFDDWSELTGILARELAEGRFRSASRLAIRLGQARVVSAAEIPPECMTMHTRGRYRDDSGAVREATLVYPGHQRASHMLVSVTSELGAALLGLSVGMRTSWHGVMGPRSVELLDVQHQPERARRNPLAR